MSNKVLITNDQNVVKVPSGLRILIRRSCNAVLDFEHFDGPAEISVTFVDNNRIHELNKEYRNKDSATDVLSFPLGENGEYDIDEDNGCKLLGDIVISMERAMEQAELYGHSLQREVAYLTVHSMLHLLGCGIHEGVLLTKPLLQTAQAQALRRSEVFGWVSLNFTGGCLAIESTPSQTQTVREPPPRQGLYASADGEILAVEIESGFAAVTVGQTVARGQLLAAAERLDRKGNAVPQGAGGRVIARVQKHYTAHQSLTAEAPVYTGRSSVQTTLYLPWRSYTDEPEDPLIGITQTDWLPVQLGRLALPASLCRVTTWEQLPDTVQYSEAAAAALALRACRAALLAEFPDAVIEAEQREISAQEGTETAAVTYIFTANIAAPP